MPEKGYGLIHKDGPWHRSKIGGRRRWIVDDLVRLYIKEIMMQQPELMVIPILWHVRFRVLGPQLDSDLRMRGVPRPRCETVFSTINGLRDLDGGEVTDVTGDVTHYHVIHDNRHFTAPAMMSSSESVQWSMELGCSMLSIQEFVNLAKPISYHGSLQGLVCLKLPRPLQHNSASGTEAFPILRVPRDKFLLSKSSSVAAVSVGYWKFRTRLREGERLIDTESDSWIRENLSLGLGRLATSSTLTHWQKVWLSDTESESWIGRLATSSTLTHCKSNFKHVNTDKELTKCHRIDLLDWEQCLDTEKPSYTFSVEDFGQYIQPRLRLQCGRSFIPGPPSASLAKVYEEPEQTNGHKKDVDCNNTNPSYSSSHAGLSSVALLEIHAIHKIISHKKPNEFN
ncbi:hypothetical protein J6590_043701 [Homalodisca vitripennis]|nr:hypothetical protein J6590_043701 [Homalodisca vitripennis]